MNIGTVIPESSLCVTMLDQTRHYFGGYYHVKVLAYCNIPLERGHFADDEEFGRAVAKLGPSVRFERVLEKMAVPEAEIEAVRSQLTRAFHKTAAAYLSAPDFPQRFVQNEYRKRAREGRSYPDSARVMCHYPS